MAATSSTSAGTAAHNAPTAPVLTRRALNRATLSRQLLLDRAQLTAFETVVHLAGMQAQAPLAPHVGLWTRLQDYDPAGLDAHYDQHTVVRANLMRATVHLVTAEDALAWYPLMAPVILSSVNGAFAKRLVGVNRQTLAAVAREVMTDAPRTMAHLGEVLAEYFPDHAPNALAYGSRGHLDLVHVTPRGQWGVSGPAAQTTFAEWLGQSPDPGPVAAQVLDRIFLRYLAAFGPASVADAQAWSGLTRLGEVAERLRPHLRTFRSETGRELFDLPDADRPDEDVPAPVRFLPEYDNLLLSHADRSRVIVDGRKPPLPPGVGARAGTLLVDGMFHGEWRIDRPRKGAATLAVETFGRLSAQEREETEAEGARLLAFIATGTPSEASAQEIVISEQA